MTAAVDRTAAWAEDAAARPGGDRGRCQFCGGLSTDPVDVAAVLRDLLTAVPPVRLVRFETRLDGALGRPHFPCVFMAVPTDGSDTPRLGALVSRALREVVDRSSEPLSAVLDDVVVALVPEDVPGGPSAVCDRVVGRDAAVSLRVRAGIGPLCREASDYAGGLRRARWVIEVLAATGGPGWATFDDIGVYGILYNHDDPHDSAEFVDRRLGPLIRYDEARGSDLVGTLHVLLEAGGVMTLAAKRLFVHISTLKYRVNRIQALLGVDLRDAQVAFDLRLASKMLWVRRHRTRLEGAWATQPPIKQRPSAG